MGLRRRRAGFTLVEMMIAISICLVMMLVIGSVFKVCTNTVRFIEVRLAVYEAARGILDSLDVEINRTYQNTRGELFAIRGLAYDYGTNPLGLNIATPPNTTAKDRDPGLKPPITDTPASPPGGLPTPDGLRYQYSRREAGSIHFARWNGAPAGWTTPASSYGGAYYFPLLPTSSMTAAAYSSGGVGPSVYPSSDFYHGAFFSTLQVLPFYTDNTGQGCCTPLTTLLQNVGRIELCGQFIGRTNTMHDNGTASPNKFDQTLTRVYSSGADNEGPNFGAPGHEMFAPHVATAGDGFFEGASWQVDYAGDNSGAGGGVNIINPNTAVSVIDFGVQYWQDAAGHFLYLPDNQAAYFAPPPKAVAVTIQVCDRERRARICLSRVIRVYCGTSNGAISDSTAPPGNTIATDGAGAGGDGYYYWPARYNRLKDLRLVMKSWFYHNTQGWTPTSNDGFVTGGGNQMPDDYAQNLGN